MPSRPWGTLFLFAGAAMAAPAEHFGHRRMLFEKMQAEAEQKAAETEASHAKHLIEQRFKMGKDYTHDTAEEAAAAHLKYSQGCVDDNKMCGKWAADNECMNNGLWMMTNCRRSCNTCGKDLSEILGTVAAT